MTGQETPPPRRSDRWLRWLVIVVVLIPLGYEIQWLWRVGPIFSNVPIRPAQQEPPPAPAVTPSMALPVKPAPGPSPEPEPGTQAPAAEEEPAPEPEKPPPAMAKLQRMLEAASPGGMVKQRKHIEAGPAPEPVSGMKTLSTFRDCELCPLMVVLPTSRFTMGSNDGNAWEQPRHTVGIAHRYALGRFEITEQQWQACVADEYCDKNAGSGGRLPVVKVNWLDTRDYVEWLSAKTGRHYRLPSEAEWAHGARGGSNFSRFWGDDRTGQCLYANGADQSLAKTRKLAADFADCNDHYARRAPVGSFKANSFGLRDTAGNVWEWVQDCWYDSYVGAPTDGRARAREHCDEFVIRGGSWRMRPEAMRSTERGHALMKQRSDDLGFRVAAD